MPDAQEHFRSALQNWIDETKSRTMYGASDVRDRLLDLLISLRHDDLPPAPWEDESTEPGDCAICGKSFDDVLAEGRSNEWIFHWGSPDSTSIAAETCCDDCSTAWQTVSTCGNMRNGHPTTTHEPSQ